MLDNNVLVSSALTPGGTPGAIVAAWRRDQYELVVSQPLLLELSRVLDYPHIVRRSGWSNSERAAFVLEVEVRSLVVFPSLTITASRDPDDDRVLEAAVAGRADYIVSGDRDLLDLETFEGIPIVAPRRFLEILEAHDAAG